VELSVGEKVVPPVGEILGYLAPGSAFLAVVFLAEGWANSRSSFGFHTPVHKIVEMLGWNDGQQQSWVIHLMLVLTLALIAYTLGHVIDAVANLAIDRILVFKGIGYPYQTLLGIDTNAQRSENERIAKNIHNIVSANASGSPEIVSKKTPTWNWFSRRFYRGLFFWVNVLLVAWWLELLLGTMPLHTKSSLLIASIARALGWWLLALILAKLMFGTLARKKLFEFQSNSNIPSLGSVAFGFKVAGAVANGLFDLLARPVGKILRTQQSFDNEFQQRYCKLFKKAFKLDARSAESNNHWMCYAFVMETSSSAKELLGRYRQLSHFSRNLAVALWFAGVYLLLWYDLSSEIIPPSEPDVAVVLLASYPILFVLSAVLIIHFYYLFVSYYSKFLFRSFVFLRTFISSR
jgi:hypothetical protein